MKRRSFLAASALAPAVVFIAVMVPVSGAGPSFRPDDRFQGSTLAGWHPQGNADWRAEKGEITGVPKTPAGGLARPRPLVSGLRILRVVQVRRRLQDRRSPASREDRRRRLEGHLPLAERGRCGRLLRRARRQRQRTEADPASVSGGGQIPHRASAGARRRGAAGATRPRRARRGTRRPGSRTAVALYRRRTPGSTPGEWNDFEILLDANIIRTFVNNAGAERRRRRRCRAIRPARAVRGRTAEVRFKDIAFKDLALRTRPEEKVSSRFRMQRLSDFYYCWGASAADFNHDGVLDIVSGPHIFFGPRLPPQPGDLPGTDVESIEPVHDRLLDAVCRRLHGRRLGRRRQRELHEHPGVVLYVNPKGEARRWDKYHVVPASTQRSP